MPCVIVITMMKGESSGQEKSERQIETIVNTKYVGVSQDLGQSEKNAFKCYLKDCGCLLLKTNKLGNIQ